VSSGTEAILAAWADDDMTDQENLARFIMSSQGGSFNRIAGELAAARTIGPSEFWAARPKNTRNGKIR
jgi:hypothetical protein